MRHGQKKDVLFGRRKAKREKKKRADKDLLGSVPELTSLLKAGLKKESLRSSFFRRRQWGLSIGNTNRVKLDRSRRRVKVSRTPECAVKVHKSERRGEQAEE